MPIIMAFHCLHEHEAAGAEAQGDVFSSWLNELFLVNEVVIKDIKRIMSDASRQKREADGHLIRSLKHQVRAKDSVIAENQKKAGRQASKISSRDRYIKELKRRLRNAHKCFYGKYEEVERQRRVIEENAVKIEKQQHKINQKDFLISDLIEDNASTNAELKKLKFSDAVQVFQIAELELQVARLAARQKQPQDVHVDALCEQLARPRVESSAEHENDDQTDQKSERIMHELRQKIEMQNEEIKDLQGQNLELKRALSNWNALSGKQDPNPELVAEITALNTSLAKKEELIAELNARNSADAEEIARKRQGANMKTVVLALKNFLHNHPAEEWNGKLGDGKDLKIPLWIMVSFIIDELNASNPAERAIHKHPVQEILYYLHDVAFNLEYEAKIDDWLESLPYRIPSLFDEDFFQAKLVAFDTEEKWHTFFESQIIRQPGDISQTYCPSADRFLYRIPGIPNPVPRLDGIHLQGANPDSPATEPGYDRLAALSKPGTQWWETTTPGLFIDARNPGRWGVRDLVADTFRVFEWDYDRQIWYCDDFQTCLYWDVMPEGEELEPFHGMGPKDKFRGLNTKNEEDGGPDWMDAYEECKETLKYGIGPNGPSRFFENRWNESSGRMESIAWYACW
jgi:hypothetical protein